MVFPDFEMQINTTFKRIYLSQPTSLQVPMTQLATLME